MKPIKTKPIRVPEGLICDPNARTEKEILDSARAFASPVRWMTREEIEKEVPKQMKSEVSTPLLDLAKKFKFDMPKPPFNRIDTEPIIKAIGDWIQGHKDALLLAWFAQYGFEPGKAVLEECYTFDGSTFRIREATDKEKEQMRISRENYERDHP